MNSDNIKKILNGVEFPGLDKTLGELNTVTNVTVEEKTANVALSFIVPANSVEEELKSSCEQALKKEFSELNKVNFQTEINIPAHKDDRKEAIVPGVKNTIAVASGKGGVGKSTVAVNLAVALAKEGAKVGLLDADIYGPSIPLMLGIEEKPKIYQDSTTGKMLPVENYGIKVMSIGFMVDDKTPVIWRGPMASGAVKQFMSDVHWGDLDYLIYDLPPGTGDIQLTLVQTIPLTGGLIVTTPQEVSLIDARKGLRMFNRVNVPVFGIIENMSYFIAPDTGKRYDIFGKGGGEKLSAELDTPFLGGIPIDTRIREGGDSGKPIVFDMPDSEQTEKIMTISRNLAYEISATNLENASSKVEIILDDDDN